MNYERTCAGWQHEVIKVFTGVAAKDYLTSQLTEDKTWDVVYGSIKDGFILGCGTRGAGDHS